RSGPPAQTPRRGVILKLPPAPPCRGRFSLADEVAGIMGSPSDEATAYHEAGHAVMALALGRPVDCVSIRATREHLGLCEFRKAVFRPSEDWLEREILISLAGVAAEARFTGNYAWDGAARDVRYAHGLAVQRAGERRADGLERRLLAQVELLFALSNY